MTDTISMPLVVPSGSLDSYIQGVNRIPLVSAEEEYELAMRFRRDNDIDAARQLVLSHLRFVVRVARGYAGYGLQQADLIQEGNIGLMKAVKRFDPDVGVRLVSFAVHWIRAEMHEFILRNWRIVKIATTKAQRKLFFNLRSARKRLGWMNGEEIEALAADLGVSTGDVMEMEQRLNGHDESFDGHVDDDGDFPVPAGYLEDPSAGPEQQLELDRAGVSDQQNLGAALEGLDERSRRIIERRWLADRKVTLQDLADEFGVSAERIRQLEQAAFGKMRVTLAPA